MSGWAAVAQIGSDLLKGWMADEAAEDQRVQQDTYFWEGQKFQKEINAQNLAFAREQMASAEAQQRRNEEMQRDFAQHGIAWRVQDAKDSGLHPVYAMSGGGAAFAPNPVVLGQYEAKAGPQRHYQVVQDGQMHYANAFGKALEAVVAALTKKEDETVKAVAASNAAVADSVARSSTPPPFPVTGDDYRWSMEWPPGAGPSHVNLQNAVDVVQYKPDEQISAVTGAPFRGAATPPGLRSYELAPGFQMLLPHSEEGPSEALENLGIASWPWMIKQNVDYYGEGWLDKFAATYPGGEAILGAARLPGRVGRALSQAISDALDRLDADDRSRTEHYNEYERLKSHQRRALAERFRRRNPQWR